MTDDTVLVTGGAGFIGQHIVDALITGGWAVRVLDDFSRFGKPERFARSNEPEGFAEFDNRGVFDGMPVEVVEGDIRDPAVVEEAVSGVRDIIHLAACSRVGMCREEPERAFQTNVGGTVYLLEAAASEGVERFLFASSREVYGDAENPVDETALLAPNNRYAVSKAAAERYVSFFDRTTPVDASILRIANVYGPGDRDRVVPTFLWRARHDEPLTVYGGEQLLDFVWIDDVVAAVMQVLDARTRVDVVNVGAGESITITKLARTIINLTGSSSDIVHEDARDHETESIRLDVSRLRDLGVEPVEVGDGLERLVKRTGGG